MPYRTLTLTPGGPDLPDPASTRPIALVGPEPVQTALAALDTLLGSGPRVLLELGLGGGDGQLVPSGITPAGVLRRYPDNTTPRVVGRLHGVPLTPGHWVGLDLVALPSGPTQRYDGPGDYAEDGRVGRVRLRVTYRNAEGEAVEAEATLEVEGSAEVYGAEPDAPWSALVVEAATAAPVVFNPSPASWEPITRGGDVVADIVIEVTGSLRPVDLAVVERLAVIAVDVAAPTWPAAMYSDGGQPYDAPPSAYPVERLAAADPGGGTEAARRALEAHADLGPVLAQWSAASEHANTLVEWVHYSAEGWGVGDNEAPPFSVTGTAPTLVSSKATTPSEQLPGWAPGHYARQVTHGDDFLDGRGGVLPVWVAAYMRSSLDTAVATFTVEAGAWTHVALTTTSTAWTWVVRPGWLEVGLGPEDAPTVRAWGHSSESGGRAQLRDLVVTLRR